MQVRHVPTIDVKYWCSLVLASIFGANTGDFFADVLNLGHLSGLPVLAVLFALALLAERSDRRSHFIYFWFVIVVIRTAATNLGDIAHDVHLDLRWAIAGWAILLTAVVSYWRSVYLARKRANPGQGGGIITSNGYYWLSMLFAGALGTVIGDYTSFGLALHPLKAAMVLGSLLVVAVGMFRNGLTRERINIAYYWITVVLIRSAGTAAGDYLAHQLQLPISTLLSGLAFIGLLGLWKRRPVSIAACANQ